MSEDALSIDSAQELEMVGKIRLRHARYQGVSTAGERLQGLC